MIRLLLFALLGATLASVTCWAVSGDESWSAIALPTGIVSFCLFILVSVVRNIASVTASSATKVEAAQAETDGRLALARVIAITRTGASINDQPICDIDLLVTPRYGHPFRVRTRKLVDIVEIPRLQPECVVVVAMEKREASAVSIVMSPPDEWVQLAASDQTVRTVRTATEWTPAAADARPAFRKIHPTFFALAFLLGLGVALVPAYDTIGALLRGETTIAELRHSLTWEGQREAEETAKAEHAAEANMFVGDNASKALDALVALVGGNQFRSITFWDVNASADAPSSPGAATFDTFQYMDGQATRYGAAAIQSTPEEREVSLFDVSTLDLSILPKLIAQARELSGIPEYAGDRGDQWVYISVSWRATDAGAERMLMIDVPINGEYYDASISFSTTGEVVAMSGGAPGSASAEAHPG